MVLFPMLSLLCWRLVRLLGPLRPQLRLLPPPICLPLKLRSRIVSLPFLLRTRLQGTPTFSVYHYYLDLGVLLSLVIQCLFAEKMEEKEGHWFFSVICGLFNNVIGVPLKLGISVLLVDSLMRKFRHS